MPFIAWALNEKPNSTTQLSPMQLVWGRQSRGPLSLLKNIWTNNFQIPVRPPAVSEYLEELKNRLNTIACIAESASEKQQSAYVNQYNKKAVAKTFKPGDRVIVLIKINLHSKLMSKWTGPCEIIEPLSDCSYLVLMPDNSRRIFHANLLRRYIDPIQHTAVVNNHVIKSVRDQQNDMKINAVHSANVNLVGVVDDSSDEFGEIIELPVSSSTDSIVDFRALIEAQCQHLSASQRGQLCAVLEKHSNVFSNSPGLCKVGEHSIRVDDTKPIPRRKIYPVPMCYREEVDRQIQELLGADIIEPSTSPYAHPFVCVRKKDGSIRLAVDYRAVNSITVPDRYPRCNANKLLLTVGKSNFITSLDCTPGFFQIKLADDGSPNVQHLLHTGDNISLKECLLV